MSSLSYANLRSFIQSGYAPKHTQEIDNFKLDKSLSTRTQQVYSNEEGQAVINHRGTAGLFDWFNNAAYMYGGEALYKLTPRYQQAYSKQKQVEKKYGKDNVITTGHSQGGLLAELVGKDSKEIITLNKATKPAFFPPKKHDNQTDIRSKCDIISAFGYYDVEIGCDSLNILKEHNSDILGRKRDKMVGEGGNNILSNSIEMNYSHLTPNALANMKHHIRPEGRVIDDSRFTTMPLEPKRKFMMRGRGLVAEGHSGEGMGKNPAEPMIKNPTNQHAVQIPEKGLRDRVSMSGRGLTAEGHSGEGMCGSGEHTMCGSDMCGSGKHKEKFTTLPIEIKPKKEMSGKGSQAMKDKMRKLREMRKKK